MILQNVTTVCCTSAVKAAMLDHATLESVIVNQRPVCWNFQFYVVLSSLLETALFATQ